MPCGTRRGIVCCFGTSAVSKQGVPPHEDGRPQNLGEDSAHVNVPIIHQATTTTFRDRTVKRGMNGPRRNAGGISSVWSSASEDEEPPRGCSSTGDDDGNRCNDQRTVASDDKLTTREIIDRLLGKRNSECSSATSEERKIEITSIQHIRQTANWDCGLACMQMIVRWLRWNSMYDLQNAHISSDGTEANSVNNQELSEKAWMVDFVGTKSIWTIDLVFLLAHILHDVNNIDKANDTSTECLLGCEQRDKPNFPLLPPASSVSYLFCSTKFGVDESYSDLGYYTDAFSSDEVRVQNLFDIAMEQNLPLLRTSHLSLDSLVEVVARAGVVAMVLLDNRILSGHRDALNVASSYSGHYVILCGISDDEDDVNYARVSSSGEDDDKHDFCMVVVNPGIRKQCQFVMPSVFERAWRAKGTDEDVIFLAKHEIDTI